MNYHEQNGIVRPNPAYATASHYGSGRSQIYTPIIPPALSTITPDIFRVGAVPHTLHDKQIRVDPNNQQYIKLGQYCKPGY